MPLPTQTMTSAAAMLRLSSAASGSKPSMRVLCSEAGKSILSRSVTHSRSPAGAYLKVPGRMVPTCGRASGTVMTAMSRPPTAGSTNSMQPVFSSYTSSVASLVQPVPRRQAKRGAKSRPKMVPPTNTAEGRRSVQSLVKSAV